MKKEIQQLERRGLPGGPNEMFTYTTGVFSTEGFRMDSPDVNNYQNIIPSGSISMKERDGSPLRKGPIHGVDNLGNQQVMYPGFDYEFPGTEVTETLLAQTGYEVPKRRGVRLNYDDKGNVVSESTHIMATETDGKGNWFSFPTLFQNSIPYADDSKNWVDMSDRPWEEAYKEAKKRNEVIEFGKDKEAAIKFGEGSWKPKMKLGGALLDKTIKCGNCGWEWKAADGGSDVMDCHKCGGKGLIKAQQGVESMYTTSGDPIVIPTQGSYPLNYRDRGDRDVDGTLFSAAKKVSRVDENGKPLTRNQIAYNQDLWNDQKEAYSPSQQAFNIWKNNEENTNQGYFVPREYEKLTRKLDARPDVPRYETNSSSDLKKAEKCNTVDGPGFFGSMINAVLPKPGCIFTDEDKSGVKKKQNGGESLLKAQVGTETKPNMEAILAKIKNKFEAERNSYSNNKIDIREVPRGIVNDNIPNATQMAIKQDEKFNKDIQYAKNIAIKKAKEQKEAEKKFKALPKEEQERILYEQYNQEHGSISEYKPNSTLSKVGQSMVLPFTALKDLYQKGEVRDNLLASVANDPKSANAYDAAYLGALGYAAAPYVASGATSVASAVSPYLAADAVVGGTTLTGVNLNNLITAGFAGHGLTHIGPDAAEMYKNPSWSNAANLTMDVAEVAPIAGPAVKMMGEGFNAVKNINTSIAPELRQRLRTNGISDLYKINRWATKIDDAATKIVGEGKNSFIYDPVKPMYHRTFESTPNFLTGYKQIKKPNQLDFSPIIDSRTEEFKNKALENFKTLTGGKGDDIDLEQFVDYFKAEQGRQNLKYQYQDFLSNINREKHYDTPEWDNVWNESRNESDIIFNKIEEALQQQNSPLGKRLGSGAEGTVYELADDPTHVIKVGQTIKTSNADDLVKSFEGITDDNIARVTRAYKDNKNLIEIMPNLNANAKFSNFTKEQVLGKLEKDAKGLMDKGFQLDVDNINGNFRYNPDKNKVDIYDISKPAAGQTSQNPEAVLRILRDHFDNAYRIPRTHPSYNPNMPTPEFRRGGLIEYQTKGEVKFGTPEYEQAYNRGEVITDEGVRSPILLNEVVIQNDYKRPRGFWEQYADKIVEENKDAGLFGAIIGTPLSAVTSLPQLAATYAITGKVQRPSEAMDIQNPYGAMAVDAIADPSNWIGAGELTALGRLSKAKAIAKLKNTPTKLKRGLQADDLRFNNTDRIVHTLDDVEFTPQDEIQELHNNLLNRFNTEEGKRRLGLLGIDNTKLNPAELSFNNTGSGYFPTDNTMDIDLQEAIQLGIDPSTVYAHETGHWLGKQYGDHNVGKIMRQKVYDTPMDKEFIASYPENLADELLAKNPNVDFGKISKETSAAYMLRNKDEGFPFLREMRQNMLNKGYINDEYDDISQETIDRFIKENPDDRISSFTEPNSKQSKTIYELFKNLPTVVPGAIGLGTVGLMQEEDGGEPSTQTIPTPSPLVEYVVKKGDTLSKIAAANNTSVRSIMKNNESIADPNVISINQKINLATQTPNAPVEEVYKDWNTIRDKKDKINKLSDEQKIVSFHNDKPEESYLIVDKKNAVMKLYTGGNLTKSFEVGVGQNAGDAQTVTKVENGKTNWSAGNKSTGAGIYTISNINPASEEYYNEPAFNLKNENGIEVSTTIHGTPKPRRIKFNNGTVVDNRMSNGCINGKCEDLKELYGQLDVNTKVYILPEDVGNNFQIIDGKPALRVSSKNRRRYNQYIDQTGAKQKGQGANQTTNTLVYKPIKATLDEAKFKDNVFQWNDFNDEKEYASTTKPFIAALTTGKKDVMKAAKISSDVYNELAKMSFGIYGTESNYGDTHGAVGNLARATNKVLDPKSSSSPDYKSKASTYGADEDYRSVGLTQLRWNYLNKDEKTALKQVGITSNKDFLDPKKAAIGTVTVLGVRYNQQLDDKQKQDVWKYLPTKWNSRANYSARVKSNSSYLSFKQLDKKQEGGEFFMAQLGMEKKPFPSYKDFLASIQKDKVVDYKERPQPVVIESTKTVIPETPKKLTKQQAKIVQKDLYEDPFKPEGITSGDKTVDFLYNNEWLMNTPIVGDYIKDRAKEIATNSGGSQTVKNINQKAGTTYYSQSDELGYTGNFGFNQTASLVDQYFSKEPLLPISKYKPSSDYLEFLPTYSVKGYFDKDPKQITQLNDVLTFNTQDSKYKEFLKNKKPIYLDENTGLPDILGVDLGGHKAGIGWDNKMNLPYLSVSDAWDFEPSHYSQKWTGNNGFKSEEDNKNDRNKAFMQSYLMHKAGNPFKVYDRFYFDPVTREYIPDDKIRSYQKGGESKPGPLMKAYNRLPKQKKIGGAIANKKQFGGQLNSGNINMYRDYIKGTIGNEVEAIKNYDKLNRIYYTKAKESGMTVANYIMTYIANNS